MPWKASHGRLSRRARRRDLDARRFPLSLKCSRLLASDTRLFWSIEMLDIIMLAIGLGFFALSIGYAYACDQL
jgi:hypothetical protein